MKTFTKTIEVYKSAASGKGYIEITKLVCKAKTLAGISTAAKRKIVTREGWFEIGVTGGQVGRTKVDRPWVEACSN